MHQRPILILGGTGKTGRRILKQLQDQGIPTRCGSRTGEPAFDWNEPENWPQVLQGCSALYITYQPDLAVPGAVESVDKLLTLAIEQGLKKFVLLSGRGEEEAQRAERVLRALDVDWTILRASWFSQNFSENFLLDAVQNGVVALPVGSVREPFVDVDDIADVAVAALTQDGHERKLYEITGPELMTFEQAVQQISNAANRPIEFVEIPPEAYASSLVEHGIPSDVASLVMYLFTTVLDGRNAYLSSGIQQALEREPRKFSDYAKAVAETGVWEKQDE